MTDFKDSEGPSVEMPRYKSHKIVHALKIKALEQVTPDPAAEKPQHPYVLLMTPVESGYAKLYLDEAFVNKHRPFVGGYYVVYPDGYKSFSPAKAFEDGYTQVI